MTKNRDPLSDLPPNDPSRLVELDEQTTEEITRSVQPLIHQREPTLCIPRAYTAICAEVSCGCAFYSPGAPRCPSCGSSEWVPLEKIDRPARSERSERPAQRADSGASGPPFFDPCSEELA